MVDQLLADIVPILEEEHAACQQLIVLVEEQRRCLMAGDVEALNGIVARGQRATARLQAAEDQRLATLRRYGYEDADDVVLSALVAQASEPLSSRCEQLRQALYVDGLALRAGTAANLRLMTQSQQLTRCLLAAMVASQRPEGYAPPGAAGNAQGVSLLVDNQV
ncbi:MAG: flagellar protein FlgN [Abditibacteriales bacterium]|nr:flagellar protein FlgN [Abditibacteriales bacterium]MDW8364567.1 flagellar protein FlgN [Abditibacteriales bacterium]